jgi:hypothetical protein
LIVSPIDPKDGKHKRVNLEKYFVKALRSPAQKKHPSVKAHWPIS